jgi:hypothetical protein
VDRSEVAKVRAELARYHQFADISEQIVEVNEAICEARAPEASAAEPPAGQTSGSGVGKGGSAGRSRRSSRPR